MIKKGIFLILIISIMSNLTFTADISEIEDFYFTLLSGKYLLVESLECYYSESLGKIYLPLSILCETFEVFYHVSEDSITGWYGSPENFFKIDLRDAILYLKDESSTLSENSLLRVDDKIFVETELIEKIFEIKIEVDFVNLSLSVSNSEHLPFFLRLKLENRWREFLKYDSETEENVENTASSYELFSFPLFDYFIEIGPSFEDIKFSVNLVNELFCHTFSLEYLWTPFENSRLSFNFSKTLNNDFLNYYSFGNITSFYVDNIIPAISGFGLIFGNHKFRQLESRVRFEIPKENWVTEAYRNNSLVGVFNFGNNNQDFAEVELYPGFNEVSLVHYGPYGQLKSDEFNYFMDSKYVQKNNLVYSAFFIKTEPSSYFSVEGLYGIENYLTMKTGFSMILKDRISRTFSLFGLIGFVPKIIDSSSLMYDLIFYTNFSNGLGVSLDTSFISKSLFFNGNVFWKNDLATPINEEENIFLARFLASFPIIPNVTLSVFSNFINSGFSNFSLSLNYANNSSIFSQNISLSSPFDGLGLVTRYQTGMNNFDILLETNVKIPQFETSFFSLYVSNKDTQNFSLSFVVSQSLDFKSFPNFQLRYSKDFDFFNFSSEIIFSDKLQLSVGFAGSVIFDGNSLNISSKQVSNSGTLKIKAFFVSDENKISPMENVIFNVNGNEYKTSKNGECIVTNLPVEMPHIVCPKFSSLSDPYIVSNANSQTVKLQEGKVTEVVFYFYYSSDILGKVVYVNNENTVPLSGIEVQLIDKQTNKIVSYERTDSEGIFYFSMLLPGKYIVSINESELLELNLNYQPIEIEVGYESQEFEIILKLYDAQRETNEKTNEMES